MYNLDDLQKETINIKNGYIKLPDFFYQDETFFHIVNIKGQIRLFNEKEFKIISDVIMKKINEVPGAKSREQLKRYYFAFNMYAIKISKSKIIQLPRFIDKQLKSVFVVGNESHLRFFKDELEYQEYYEKNNNNPKRIH